MTKLQRWPVIFTGCVCAMAMTAGLVDIMVNEAASISADSKATSDYAANLNDYQAQPLPQEVPTGETYGPTLVPLGDYLLLNHTGSTWAEMEATGNGTNIAKQVKLHVFKTESAGLAQIAFDSYYSNVVNGD